MTPLDATCCEEIRCFGGVWMSPIIVIDESVSHVVVDALDTVVNFKGYPRRHAAYSNALEDM